MHVTLVSTYPPAACGIATYTRDLRDALPDTGAQHTAAVVAVTPPGTHLAYPCEVAFEIRRRHVDDYVAAAAFINASPTQVVSLQHEFGIFGGAEGAYANALLERLTKPVVTTLHTVLSEPSSAYFKALIAVTDRSDHLAVMSRQAKRLLADVYAIPEREVSVIHHGVPELPFTPTEPAKEALGLDGRTVLMTFGLVGPGKGIEFVLDALPHVSRRHPDVCYVVLGATHPEVRRHDGETYRHTLQACARALGIENHVLFVDRYVDTAMLYTYLQACDIYITPYPGRDQICSGTLAYALGAGKAIVSTPYLYAEELLANGRGRLVASGGVEALAATLDELMADDDARNRLRARAYAFSRRMTWPRVGSQYLDVFATTHRMFFAPDSQPSWTGSMAFTLR